MYLVCYFAILFILLTGFQTLMLGVVAGEPRQLVSRPASPTLGNDSSSLVNGGAVLAAALQKKMNRKRKAPSIDNEVCFIDFFFGTWPY